MNPTRLPCHLAACVLVLGLTSCASAPATTPPAPAEEPPAEKPEVKTLEFRIEIAAPVARVWDTMLDPDGYRQWTEPFFAGSYFEGSWSEGERMHFLAPGGSGVVAEIAALRPHELVSIRHIGLVMNGVEDTTSDGVRSWAPVFENYHFAATPGGTELTIEQEVFAGSEASMHDIWPRALAVLKSLCEADERSAAGS